MSKMPFGLIRTGEHTERSCFVCGGEIGPREKAVRKARGHRDVQVVWYHRKHFVDAHGRPIYDEKAKVEDAED